MKNTLVTLFAAGFVIASCSVNEIDGDLANKDTKAIYASTEVGTKTSLGENEDGVYKVSWSEGDRIVLIDERGYTATYATEEEGKSRARFTFKKGQEDLEFENGIIAGYPEKNIYLFSPDPEVPVFISIPSNQEYKENSFADDVMPMVSDVTTDKELKFNNAAGVIRLMISAAKEITVQSITINSPSEFISGECGYTPESMSYFFDDNMASEKSIVLSCGKGITVNEVAKPFFVVVPHQKYTDLEIVVKNDDGYEKRFEMKSGKTLTVKRSAVATIPLYVNELRKSDEADVQFEPYSVTWSYRYFDRGNERSRYFNTDDQAKLMEWKADNNGAAPYFDYPEINVTTSRVEISMLKDTIPDADIHKIDFRIDNAEDRYEIKAYDPDGNEIKYESDGITPFLNGDHYIVLNALTSKVARLTEVNLPFMDFPVIYKARKFVVNEDNMMRYSIAFDITLGATPEDKEIDLGTFTIAHTQANVSKVPVNPITLTVAADAEAFADLPAHDVQYFAATVGPWNDTWSRVTWNQKDIGYLELRSPEGYDSFAYVLVPSAYSSSIEENAYLEIPQNAEYDSSYVLEETWSFYGIEYTFKATVNCQKPVYHLVANPRFVKDGVVELSGKVIYPQYADGSYNGVGNNDNDAVLDKYTLDNINLRDYVVVEGMSELDKLYDELQVSYKVKETRLNNSLHTAPLGVSFEKDADPAVLETSQWAYNAYYDDQDNYVELTDPVMLYWDSVDQDPDNKNPFETINEIEVEYQLLSHNGQEEFGDPLTLKLMVPELLKFETTKTLTEPWKTKDIPTVANIYKALSITDTKSGTQINNPEATNAADFFDYTYKVGKKTETKYGVRNVYEIEIVPDASNVKIYLKSGIALSKNDYIFDPETGNVQLPDNSGNLTDNIIIEIPVAMYHMYQGSHSHNVTVKIEFTK